MNLLKKSLAAEPNGAAATFGHLFLRISAGLMIFYIHGWHKLEGWIAYLQNGTPWKLAGEIAGMHFPAPLASAVVATASPTSQARSHTRADRGTHRASRIRRLRMPLLRTGLS